MEEINSQPQNTFQDEKQEDAAKPADPIEEKVDEAKAQEERMNKLLEEYLTLIEEDDQDIDKDQLIQVTLDTKGHLMDDEVKVRSMEHIIHNKLSYREQLLGKYQDLKRRIQIENLENTKQIIKEIDRRQRKRFDEMSTLSEIKEKIQIHKKKLRSIQWETQELSQMSKSAAQFNQTSKSSNLVSDQLIFIREEMQKDRKEKFDKLITRQLKVQQKKLEDEDRHQRFRIETELKQKQAQDNLEQARTWQIQMLQSTSKQREDQFRSQQLIQHTKNDFYVQSLIQKQAEKERQLEMIKNYQQEYQQYQKVLNEDKFKGNEQKKQMALQRKLDEIEHQRIVNHKQYIYILIIQLTEQKTLKDLQKVQHIESIHKMHQEFLQNQGLDEMRKTQEILLKGQLIVEEKNKKANEKWSKQAQYKQLFDRLYYAHQHLVQQEHEQKRLKIIHEKNMKEIKKEEQTKQVFLKRVKSQDVSIKQLERKKREDIEAMTGKQVLRHIQFQEKKKQLELEQELKHQRIMEKRSEQDFKIRFFEEERKKVLQEKEQIEKYLEEERKRIDMVVSKSQKFGNNSGSVQNLSAVML